MWKMALGIALFLQAGVTRAAEDDSAVHVDCPPDSTSDDCTADEVVVPEAPPSTPTATTVATAPAAFATVSFRNDVGKTLRLIDAQFTMDGAPLTVALPSSDPGKSYVIASGAMKPGPHVVTARLTYQGDRGVFSYMKGYKLNVRSNQVLTTPADRTVSFTVVGAENKGINVPLERRVTVRVEEGSPRK
jgi:hypothetical protein